MTYQNADILEHSVADSARRETLFWTGLLDADGDQKPEGILITDNGCCIIRQGIPDAFLPFKEPSTNVEPVGTPSVRSYGCQGDVVSRRLGIASQSIDAIISTFMKTAEFDELAGAGQNCGFLMCQRQWGEVPASYF